MASAVISAVFSGIGAGFSYAGAGVTFSWTAAAWAFGSTPVLSAVCTQLPEVPHDGIHCDGH